MEPTELKIAIVDAGPLIHLDELGRLDLIAGFTEVWISDVVMEEASQHRPNADPFKIPNSRMVSGRADIPDELVRLQKLFQLGAGEVACLTLARREKGSVFLSDDMSARLAAGSFGVRVHGTIGLITRAIRLGLVGRLEAVGLIESLPTVTTLHVSRSLLREVMDQIQCGDV